MILHETISEPMQAVINGQAQTVRQKLVTHKIVDDESMKDFHVDMSMGRQIVAVVNGKDHTFITVLELIPVKIAMQGDKPIL